MTREKEIEIFNRATERWGKLAQFLVAVEEMAELTVEILNNCNRGMNNEGNIREEIADVEIMMSQLRLLLDVPDVEDPNLVARSNCSIDQWKDYKITRLEERLNASQFIDYKKEA